MYKLAVFPHTWTPIQNKWQIPKGIEFVVSKNPASKIIFEDKKKYERTLKEEIKPNYNSNLK